MVIRMMKRMKKLLRFLRHGHNRKLYLEVLLLSAYYRVCMLVIPMNVLKKHMGALNEESGQEETIENHKKAIRISNAVNKVCDYTPWKSRCLVRALTAQHLLKKCRVPSTLYLGVGTKSDNMIAHAWLRSGKIYLTGGKGEEYALVAKFRT